MNKKISAALCVLLLAVGVLPALAQGAPGQAVKLKVTAEQANLREKPDISSAVVQQIPQGTVLEADRKDGEWYLVRYTLEDGGVIAGYIHESLVTVVGQAAPAAAAAAPAAGAAAAAAQPQAKPAAEGSDSWYEVFLPFDVRLAAGAGGLVADDFNAAAKGVAGYNGASIGLPSTGSANSLHLSYIMTVDVAYRLSRTISLGLGFDFTKGWRESHIAYYPPEPAAVTPETATRPFVKSVPVRLSVYFYPRPDFYFRGSLAFYSVTAGYYYKFVRDETVWTEEQGQGTAHTVGLEVGAGYDFPLGRNVFLFGEAGFRLAQASGLTGSGSFRDWTGTSVSVDGDLWFFQAQGADGHSYDMLLASETQPSGEGLSGARRASINLSGMTLRLGVKFRF